MGLSWFCDHEWHFSHVEFEGFWRDKRQNYHKCSKCGKTEKCNEYGENPYVGGSHDGDRFCTKCGSG